MSLTKHLEDAESPVRAYIDGISPVLLALTGRTDGARAAADALGFIELAASTAILPPFPGVDVARAGTAVDFRVRIALGGFDAHDSAAALGVADLSLHQGEVENGAHRVKVLSEAFDVAVQILETPSSEADLDRAALLLAHCEQMHRAMIKVLKGSVGTACDLASGGKDFANGLDTPSLADLRSMMESNSAQIDLWREQIANGDRFEPNPVFAGSRLVGGADADWLVGDVLIDSKAYAELTVPKLRACLRQLLGYVMLDLDDSLRIRTVGVWLPRQGLTRTWGLEMLLGGDPEELMPTLREGFLKAAGGQQMGIHVPVTQHRKNQMLADNKNTPQYMLAELARNSDAGIRFRIGRNAMIPEATMRELARDRYASVREGVAGNESAPTEVLAALAHDRSVVVRRAATANPRTPKAHLKVLGAAHVVVSSSATRLSIESVTGGEVAQSRESGPSVVRILQDRDDGALDRRWFSQFLALTRGTSSGFRSRIPLPMASEYWATEMRRSTAIPNWLMVGIPDIVKEDLIRRDRPDWVRQMVALDLPVVDSSVLATLLADADPKIRWSALQRTVDVPDDLFGALLGELAASREERIRFRTEGDNQPAWVRSRTPAESEKETLELVATHPSTPLANLRDLAGTKSVDVLVALIENSAFPAEDLALLLPRLRSTRSFEPRERLAASSKVPSAAARILAGDRDARVRVALARNEAAPFEMIVSLAEDQDPSVRLAVVANPRAPVALAASIAETLLKISTGEELLQVLKTVATRPDIQLTDELFEDALERISKSRVRDPDMRRTAADNERTGARTLARLAKSADESVRCAVAGNSRTPSETLSALAADPVHRVRAAAAGNESLDVALIIALANDEEPIVRARAAGCPRLDAAVLGDLLLDDDRSVRTAAFNNAATTAECRDAATSAWVHAHPVSPTSRAKLEEMVANTRAEVRMQVALDPSTPPDILRLLGGERGSALVRRAVAANPNTPASTLALLADDKDTDVRHAVAFNGATPPEVLAALAGSSIDLALLVAMNPDAPAGVMDALAEDGDPLVGYIAAGARATRSALVGEAGGVRGRASDAGVPSLPLLLIPAPLRDRNTVVQ
ncbi:hypothetical protein [Cryobacterium sp. M91]|uniref:variant leucine-rich repeat-containing protein n=1 Tax=Cryobacterium sp. M91 TaxID=2048294 RepID=UPI000CE4855C|nr:hypothetical protein [Cryobacterium sp. M91]